MTFKPMLAKEAPADLGALTYPQIVQPKLDGIRCTIVNGQAVSRTLKPIPNDEIRTYLSDPRFEGLDGEIVVGDPSDPNAMQNTTTIVMSKSKPAGDDWAFYVFDRAPTARWDINPVSPADSFLDRQPLREQALRALPAYPDITDRFPVLDSWMAYTPEAVGELEAECLAQGYEGVILRDPSAPYKHGRSGKKGPLLKLKRFIDFEAEIIGLFELMHNANEAKTNALGRTERSTALEGMQPSGVLGGFYLRAINGPHEGQEFKVGTGFDAAQRADLWHYQHGNVATLEPPSGNLIGLTVKIKSFPVGVKDAPRFPVFLGFRDMEIDG